MDTKNSGFIIWFTGLSGVGKSTLAVAVRPRLQEARRSSFGVEILDGDEIRKYLSKGLGFSNRDENIRRIGFVARVLARNGAVAICAAISPYSAIRDEVRELAKKDGVPFIEVFLKAELDSLVKRDTKGLYKKALAGEIKNFTGVSDPYEEPKNPELTFFTDKESIDESVEKLFSYLNQRGLLTT